MLVGGVNEFWTELIGSPNAPVIEGVYRLDRVGSGTTRATLVADIYTWSEENPPLNSNYFVPGGYTYAMEPYGDGFLVTNAHHNRVLRVRQNGDISVFTQKDANHYQSLGEVSTAEGARTSLFVRELRRLYVAVPTYSGQEAVIRVYEAEANR